VRHSGDSGRRGGQEALLVLHVQKGIMVASQHQKGRGGRSAQRLTEGGDLAAERRQCGGSLVTQVRRAQPSELLLEAGSHRDLRTRRDGPLEIALHEWSKLDTTYTVTNAAN
jgi:hypothetical protein